MGKYGYNTFAEEAIIKKINELYITNRKNFLKLDKEGKYSTINHISLHDGMIRNHIRGIETIGVFSGQEVSKFVCFDIDMIDKSKLKWIYHLLIESLVEIGINIKYLHVSLSGNKGLHVNLFVKGGSSLKHFKYLFEVVMKYLQQKLDESIKTILFNVKELKLEIKDICNIEFRPTNSQGVKLELGRNFKNNNMKTNECLFVHTDTLKPYKSKEHILFIEPMPKEEFMDLMESLYDSYEKEIELHKELIKQEIKEPHSHKVNKDEDVTIQHIIDLIQNGLYMPGTRHNSILKISKYFRYMGMSEDSAIEELKEWMRKQNKKYYSVTLDEALSECERICRIVYQKEYSLVGHVDNLRIYKSEMKEIIKIKNRNDKILLFTMLLHSKRYSLQNGVFYMTYKQIKEMCNIDDKGAMQSLKRLESENIIEIVSRNVRQDNNFKHLPNKYKINIDTIEDEIALEIDNSLNYINNNELYTKTIINTFTNTELKHLPVRQYNEFTKLRNTVAS